MNTNQAQSAVTLSAFVVGGVYLYRKMTETSSGKGTVPPVAHFVIGFGFVFIALSLVAQGAPELGGMFAVLVATGDLLANGTSLVDDLTGALKTTSAGATVTPATSAAVAALPALNQQLGRG